MTPEELNEKIEQIEEKLLDYSKKIEELEKENKELVFQMEKHKHSGKETADIANILQERLGISISTALGTAEIFTIDIGNVFKASGSTATGRAILEAKGKYAGLTWSGGDSPMFTMDSGLILPNLPATFETTGDVNGSIYYDTTNNRIRAYINSSWETIS
jgi:hypothetical protein